MLEQGEAIYFDGQSNRKRKAVIRFGPALEIVADGVMAAAWPYGDVRRVDSAPGACVPIDCTKVAPIGPPVPPSVRPLATRTFTDFEPFTSSEPSLTVVSPV